MGEMLGFNQEQNPTLGTEYATIMSPDLVAFYAELGVADDFLPILTLHLSDLQLTLSDSIPTSHLDLVPSHDPGDRQVKWKRRAVISLKQLKSYQKVITDAVTQYDQDDNLRSVVAPVYGLDGSIIEDGSNDKTLSAELAIDWLFFELTVDALANSYYMQQKYGRYIPDFNGQAPYYEAELSIARKFLEGYGTSGLKERALLRKLSTELKFGVALLLTKDNLIRKNVANAQYAGSITEYLRLNYPRPYSPTPPTVNLSILQPTEWDEVVSRLGILLPREPTRTARVPKRLLKLVKEDQ